MPPGNILHNLLVLDPLLMRVLYCAQMSWLSAIEMFLGEVQRQFHPGNNQAQLRLQTAYSDLDVVISVLNKVAGHFPYVGAPRLFTLLRVSTTHKPMYQSGRRLVSFHINILQANATIHIS